MLMYTLAMQGGLHRFVHRPSQDFTASHRRGSVAGVALSDGAGSLPHSGEGAQATAGAVIIHMVNYFDALWEMSSEAVSRRLAHLILCRLTQCAEAMHASVADFGSTLLAVCADARSGRYIAVHLGDGVIMARDHTGQVNALSLPQRGERAASTFLTPHLAICPEYLRVQRGSGLKGFMLTSDGAENSLYCQQGRVVSPSISSLFDELAACPMAFDASFQHAVHTDIRPVDDFSVCMLSLEPLSSMRLLSRSDGNSSNATSRRITRSALRYAAARDAGATPCLAARHAGWRKQDMPHRMAMMASIGVEPKKVFSKF